MADDVLALSEVDFREPELTRSTRAWSSGTRSAEVGRLFADSSMDLRLALMSSARLPDVKDLLE